jgi:PBSX family phage terminase large subunit
MTNTTLNGWKPHSGPQEFALRQPDSTFETLYGGARGGGKTDAGINWMADPIENPMYRGLVIRRNGTDLTDWIDRAQRMYQGYNAEFGGNPTIIKFPSGAKIYTGHLQDDKAYTKYLGHEYQRILIEELTQIPNEKRYKDLLSSCRSTVTDLIPRVFLTTNPGGVGHGWVKARFVDPAPASTRFLNDMNRKAIFIPARIDDNPTLVDNDPDYIKLLDSYKLSDPDKYKAWRLGDWDVYEGQVFSEWKPLKDGKEYHVISKIGIPYAEFESWPKYIGFDWGFNDPAALYWMAIAPENDLGVKHIYVYREMYQNNTTSEEWADRVNEVIQDEPIRYMVMPHDAYSRLGGSQTIESRFRAKGVPLRRTLESGTHKQKLGRQSMLHNLLSESPDGRPYLQVFDTCRNLIRTIPALPYSETKPEEIDDKSEDHAYDAVTYGLYTITGGKSWIVNPKLPKDNKPKSYVAGVDVTHKDLGLDLDQIMKPKEKSWQYR